MDGKWRFNLFKLRAAMTMVVISLLHQHLRLCWCLNSEGTAEFYMPVKFWSFEELHSVIKRVYCVNCRFGTVEISGECGKRSIWCFVGLERQWWRGWSLFLVRSRVLGRKSCYLVSSSLVKLLFVIDTAILLGKVSWHFTFVWLSGKSTQKRKMLKKLIKFLGIFKLFFIDQRSEAWTWTNQCYDFWCNFFFLSHFLIVAIKTFRIVQLWIPMGFRKHHILYAVRITLSIPLWVEYEKLQCSQTTYTSLRNLLIKHM